MKLLSTAVFFGAVMLAVQGMGAQTTARQAQAPAAVPRQISRSVKVESSTTSQTINTTTTVGQLTGFKSSKSITVTSPGGRKTFDLSKSGTTATGGQSVRVGQIVSVTEVDRGKQRTITIQPYTSAVRTDTVAEAAVMQAETQASGQVPYQITQDVKQETPGATTELKVTTAVGKVTAYHQGDTLTLAAPHNRTTKFDLKPDGTTVTGDKGLMVGQTVKVTETQQGEHTTLNIQPVPGM